MSPPGKKVVGAEDATSPAATTKIFASTKKPDQRKGTATIAIGKVSARVWVTSPAAERVLRRAVPRRGREYDHVAKAHVIYGSRVRSLLDAFAAAGVPVTELGEPA